jgi:hypothetical protein
MLIIGRLSLVRESTPKTRRPGVRTLTQRGIAQAAMLLISSDSVGAIARGPDGNIWFANYDMFSSRGSIWRVSMPTLKLTPFHFSQSQEIDGLAGGLDKGLWFTTTDNSTGVSAIGKMATA